MKRYLLSILLPIIFLVLGGFKSTDPSYIYRDLGEYVYNMPNGDRIGVKAYILKTRNTHINSPYKYIFTLVAQSTSLSRGRLTDTWLYNTRIYLNDMEVSYNQFPEGFTMFLSSSSHTNVYYWFTNDEHIGKYYLTWGSSAYIGH